MSFEERNAVIGMVLGLVAFGAYWVIVIARAASDDLPFSEVAWQGPMLLIVAIGGGAYAIVYGTMRWRVRRQLVSDARDREILDKSDAAGAGLVSLSALIALIMLALDADAFWVAHVLFVMSFLGSMVSSAAAIAMYREGVA
ncbi:hypothetical protein [uncultured Demequina sp.]|uniref:hypothetical protein n=1 Tax=uncultured Demequina sp. TaxID=693499 RepID=UPI0025D963A4|nr:hypothetical protein [uncultured Demequina sp.]